MNDAISRTSHICDGLRVESKGIHVMSSGEFLDAAILIERLCMIITKKEAVLHSAEERLVAANAKIAEYQQLAVDRKDLRNELCLYCGKYKRSHLGACDGCRWQE